MTTNNITPSQKAAPQHAAMDQFPVVDNELQVGGIPLTKVAARAGQTPFYAYDRKLMTERVNSLRQQLPDAIHLHYAIKANPMPAVVQHFAQHTDGLDVASLGELRVALDTGIDPQNISFAGPGKSNDDLTAAIAAGVIINMESAGELDRITRIANENGHRPRVAIRVNPDFELKTSGMKMGGGPKPFGVDAEKVPAMMKDVFARDLDFQGFHIFCGSQNLKAETIIEAQTNTFELAQRLADSAPSPIQWLNIGGGLGVPYFPGEERLELPAIADNLDKLLVQYHSTFGNSEIVMELGRHLVAEAGLYVCEVVDRKESRGEVFIVTNGGLHHHLAASGNFGQVIRKNYPTCVGNRVHAASTDDQELVSVVGPLCTPLDILANKVMLPKMQEGDLFVVYQSGAYGMTASPQGFLSHPAAVEILC
ncbi:pyridoxal-dependent decarboxylase, exosortase A system-associated [Pseudomaricurvus sp.]|uniref:pyridoxal-dependent decarboxylase, exosortase A system-associated n=1 Tax=Pseudomaricurvus sp. TaxID=2004510 RepID=UPI003F6D4F43